MKKLIAVTATVFLFASWVFANKNENLTSSFNKAFPLAENVKWSKDVNGYFVSFTQLGILSKAAYDHEGTFLYALRYYKEDNLPISILAAVKEKFETKKILAVIEVSTDDGVEYHIKLKDAKFCYGIRVTSSGSITTEERFKRSDF